jgi:hypothetical protein
VAGQGGVAFFAHIGGFIAGMGLLKLMLAYPQDGADGFDGPDDLPPPPPRRVARGGW